MKPIIYPGDITYIKKINFKRVQTNDLVMIRRNHRLFTHRVIYKTPRYIITKGDNHPDSDGKSYPHNLVGKIVKIKRGKYIFQPEDMYLLQSTVYFKEIIRLKNIFEKENIDHVFLKGLPLHLYIEKLHPKRLFLDCDILIRDTDYANAEKILQRSGYKKSNALQKENPVEITYNKIVEGIMVSFDLHSKAVFTMTRLDRIEALYPQKLIDQLTSDMLRTKRSAKIQGKSFFILDTYCLILYLALHFFHHSFRGAFRLELLAKIVSQTTKRDFSWISLTNLILKYRLQNFVYPGFDLLRKYYKTPITKRFLASIQPSNLHSRYFSSRVSHRVPIFDDEPRIKLRINRFINLFFLSPSPLWKKLPVLLYPQVISMIFRSLWNIAKEATKNHE